MSAGTDTTRWSQPRTGSEGVTLEWLDALAAGTCTPEAFLAAMRGQFRGSGDQGWEVVSLLDQYYRRGKIKADVFQSLKSRLESSAIKGEEEMAASGPASVRPRPAVGVRAPAAALQNVAAQNAAAQRKATPVSPAAAREVAVGDVLRDRYRIRGLIGHGVMGTVFEAMDEYRLALPAAGQRVAIKVLHPAVTQRDEVLIELQRQFQHVQFLSHPNIIRVHEFDRDGDIAFFTMELLNGAPLSGILTVRNATGLPRPYALAVMRDLGAALSYAHSRGVVHGDVSPANIFVTNEGELRIMDFGGSNRTLRDRWAVDIELSDTAPVAPPGYASCQILEGQQPDARDDVFAFACVAYVLLAGRHPFPNRTAVEARAQRLRFRSPPGLSGRQWRVLREGLRWERDHRPSDLQKWMDRFHLAGAAPRLPALPRLVNAPPTRMGSGVLTTAVITLLAVLAAAGFWAVADHESFTRHIRDWTSRVSSTLGHAGSAPTTSVPTASVPTASVPRASAPPVATKPAAPAPAARQAAPAPSAPVVRTAPAARANPIPAPEPAAPSVAPSSLRADSSTRPTMSDASARAAAAGPIRIEMAADTVEVQSGETMASVTVHRRGNLHGDASFKWWTESGTAKPGLDFAPAMPRSERIEDGGKSVILNIPVSARSRTQPKSFYVVIDRTDTGPALGERTLTMVTLQPTE
ncbi:MAG TPA: protein kinase [Steroidobacteraceae bacterium]|nr:protein kinase [Steroidobacteraceae bacterium]